MSCRPPLVLAAALALLGPPALSAAQPAPPAPALSAPALSAEDQALVDHAAQYLDGLTLLRGRFVQTDARGNVSQGELYLNRPGKARFEYDRPASLLVISNGHTVGVFDSRLKTADRYPLLQTPLNLFLQKHVTLEHKVVVTKVQRFAGGFSLTLKDAKKKTPGQITLTFADAPTAIREWSVIDAQGGRTTVRLSDLRPVSRLDENLFVLPDPNPNPIR
jgi:outer membrane lipoprotein-sorting protein